MSNRTIIITGASSGVGKETAKLLQQQGNHVIGIARHATVQQDLKRLGVSLFDIDLTQPNEIKQTMGEVLSQIDHLDALINVAGVGINGPLELISESQSQTQFQVNVMGVMRMIREVLPMMRRQGVGNIINISSVMGRAYQPMLGWYAATKHMLETLTDTLRVEVAPFGINVSLIEPNGIATPMGTGTSNFADQFGDSAYRDLAVNMDKLFSQGAKKNVSATRVAELIIHVMTQKRPRPRYAIGYLAKTLMAAAKYLPTRLYDHFLRQLLG